MDPRGAGCEISCAHFSSEMADHRDFKLCTNASLSIVDVYIIRTGGSNNFSLSYSGSKRGGASNILCSFSVMSDYRGLKLCTMLHHH